MVETHYGRATNLPRTKAEVSAWLQERREKGDARRKIFEAQRSAKTCMVLVSWPGGGTVWYEQSGGYGRAELVKHICAGEYDDIIAIVEIDGLGNASNIEAEIAATLAKLPVQYDPETGDPYLDLPDRAQNHVSPEAGKLTAHFGYGDICDRLSSGRRA